MRVKETWETKWCDYYKLLGISYNDDEKAIKSAYRKLVQELHPDAHPGFESIYQEKIRKINVAYEILSDPVKKERYDLEYKKRLNATTNTQEDNHTNKKENRKSNTTTDFNNYSKEETEATRKKAIEKEFAKEKAIASQNEKKVADAIDNLVLKAYMGTINEELYQKNYEILMDLLKVRINKFKVLHQEAQKLSMQQEIDEIEQIIAKMQAQINQVPKKLIDAKQFVEKQLKIEDIRKFCISKQEQTELLKQAFNNLLTMVFDGQIKDANIYQKKLEQLLIKARTRIEEIDKNILIASEYNEFEAMQYLKQYKLIINNLGQSTPKVFEEIKSANDFFKDIEVKICNINRQLNHSKDSDEKIRLYSIRIELLGEQAKQKYLRDNLPSATTEIQRNVVITFAEISYYEAKQKAISEEQKRLKSISYAEDGERAKKAEYVTEQQNLTRILRILEKKYARLLNEKKQEEYVNSKPQPKTEEEKKLDEVNGKLEGTKEEQERLKIKLEDKEYRNALLKIESEKIELLGEQAKQKYLRDNLPSATTEIQRNVVITFAEISYYEAKQKAISEEQKRLKSISYAEDGERAKKAEYVTEQQNCQTTINLKKSYIEKMNEFANLQRNQNANFYNNSGNFEYFKR